jgi:hypothetical protein
MFMRCSMFNTSNNTLCFIPTQHFLFYKGTHRQASRTTIAMKTQFYLQNEIVCTSETHVPTHQTTTQCYYSEDHNMKPHHCENFKSYLLTNIASYCTFLTRVFCMLLYKKKWHITFHLCYAIDYTSNALISFFIQASCRHKRENMDKKLQESKSEFYLVHSRKVIVNILINLLTKNTRLCCVSEWPVLLLMIVVIFIW